MGRIVGVFGVKGWIKLESDTRPRKAIFNYGPWALGLKGGWQRRALITGKPRGNGLVARIEGVDDRDQAYELVGVEIALPRDELPAAEQGAVYWADLQGCTVVNQLGIEFGKVASLMETGANDVLVVRNGRERLIPYIDEVIEEVDLNNRRIRVNWEEDF